MLRAFRADADVDCWPLDGGEGCGSEIDVDAFTVGVTGGVC